MRTKKISRNAAVGLALVCLGLPLAAQAQRPAAEENDMDLVPLLSVSGSGQARVAPDEASVRLGVLAQAKTARAAQEQVNRVANAILASVQALGVRPEQIQTSELNLSPLYSQGRPEEGRIEEPRITGYQASNVVIITLQDLTKVGPVIDAGLAAGANRLDGVFFGLRNDQAARAQALTAAVAEARSKAEALAKAAGVRLGDLVEITEGGIAVTPVFRQERMAMANLQSADTAVSSGQVGVDASVTLRYRIVPGNAQ